MAKELKVDGRMKVATLKAKFKEIYGIGIRVYYGKRFADDNVSLTSIRDESAKGGNVPIHGRTKIGNVEKMFKEQLGIRVQIENSTGDLADNNISLAQVG